MKWLIVAAVLLVGCEKKSEPAKDLGSAAAVGSGSGAAVGGSGSAAPVAADTGMAEAPADKAPPAIGSAAGAPGSTGCDNAACAMVAMKGFRDEMCKCTDKDCGQRVTESMTKWAMDAGPGMNQVKPNEAEMKAFEQVGKELGECTTKAMMAGMDTPPPTGDLSPPTPIQGFHKQRTTPIGKKPSKKPACMASGSASIQCTIEGIGYYTDMMCACPDKTCGEGLVAEMTKWAEDAAKSAANTQPSPADMKKMEEIGKRLGECTSDVMLTDPTAK